MFVFDPISGEETPNPSRHSLRFFAAARELLSPLAWCLAQGPSVIHWPKRPRRGGGAQRGRGTLCACERDDVTQIEPLHLLNHLEKNK